MAGFNAVLGYLTVLLAIGFVLSAPGDKVTANDVHLNAVLPESEIPTTNKEIIENHSDPLSAASDDAPHLEFEDEVTTKIPTIASPPKPNDPTYFSRVITSIFEIPIAVLNAVRNLVNTAATPKVVTNTN